MFRPFLLVYLEDSRLKIEIETIAQKKKVDFYFATRGDQLAQFVKTYVPFLLLVDLSGLDSGWIFRHISIIKYMKPDFPVCAVIQEDEEHLYIRAEKYGCDKILTKSELIEKLPDIIEAALTKTL